MASNCWAFPFWSDSGIQILTSDMGGNLSSVSPLYANANPVFILIFNPSLRHPDFRKRVLYYICTISVCSCHKCCEKYKYLTMLSECQLTQKKDNTTSIIKLCRESKILVRRIYKIELNIYHKIDVNLLICLSLKREGPKLSRGTYSDGYTSLNR